MGLVCAKNASEKFSRLGTFNIFRLTSADCGTGTGNGAATYLFRMVRYLCSNVPNPVG